MSYDPLEAGVKESVRAGTRGARGAARGLFSFSTFKFFLTLFVFGGLAVLLFNMGVFGDTTIGVSLGGFGQNKDLSNGLVGHWTFDGPDMLQNVTDTSGSGNNGELSGVTSTTTVIGKLGQAIFFDTSGAEVSLDRPTTNTTNISMSGWFKWNGSTSPVPIILYVGNSGANGYGLIISNGSCGAGSEVNLLLGGTTCDALNSSYNLTAGVWTFLVLTRSSGGQWNLYADGVLRHTGTTNPGAAGNEFYIGRYIGGLVDDVRFYTRELTAEDVERLYELGNTTHVGISLGGQGENKDLSSGLVGHWTFDGSDLLQNITDSSGVGGNGFLSGFTSTTTVRGKLGQALSYDGTDDFSQISHSSALTFGTNPFTISLWFKPRATFTSGSGTTLPLLTRYTDGNSNSGLFLAGTDFLNSGLSAGRFLLKIEGNANSKYVGTSQTTWEAGQWYHVVAVINSTAADSSTYVNGQLDRVTGTNNGGPFDDALITAPWRFGKGDYDTANVATGNYFSGEIDDIRVYNRALSAEEISRLYGLGNTTRIGTTLGGQGENKDLSNGLVGHWTFDGPNLLTNVTDSSGVGNTGYLTNFTSTTTVRGKLGQALQFDGDDYIFIGQKSSLQTAAPKTFSAWVTIPSYPPDGADFDGFWIAGDEYNGTGGAIYIASGGYPAVMSSDGAYHAVLSSTKISLNEWHHIVGLNRGSVAEIYVDGVRVNSSNVGMSANSNTFAIGTFYSAGSPGRYMKGQIDDVRVYNRVLSAEEIQRLYDLGR